MLQIQNCEKSFLVSKKFIDKYLCDANGSFVKVYLYTLRHLHTPDLTIEKIAQDLNLLESDVIRAFKYWSKLNVVEFESKEKDDFLLKFLELDNDKENTFEKDDSVQITSKPKSTTLPSAVMYSKSDINNYMKNNDGIRQMFVISSQLLNKVLTDTDRKILFGFYDYLKLPVDVIFLLIEYCVSIDKTNMRYIEKVAFSWADAEINTFEKASEYIKEHTKLESTYKKFKQMFRIQGRDFTDTEQEYIELWTNKMKFTDEEILNAYETTVTNTGKVAFKYMNAVLQNSVPGKTTIKNSNKKTSIQKNSFQNYDDDEVKDFELEMMKNRIIKNNLD